MYFPTQYEPHNESLEKFIKIFNNISQEKFDGRIIMDANKKENYREDGRIIDTLSGKNIYYDWEKRHSYYIDCGFPFATFGQFERKIQKLEILLSIQCNKLETCFIIAWHEDFKRAPKKFIKSKTSNGYEKTPKRFINEFKEFKYSEMEEFYKVLQRAFDNNIFNHTIF